jgi:hypothetical protein
MQIERHIVYNTVMLEFRQLAFIPMSLFVNWIVLHRQSQHCLSFETDEQHLAIENKNNNNPLQASNEFKSRSEEKKVCILSRDAPMICLFLERQGYVHVIADTWHDPA